MLSLRLLQVPSTTTATQATAAVPRPTLPQLPYAGLNDVALSTTLMLLRFEVQSLPKNLQPLCPLSQLRLAPSPPVADYISSPSKVERVIMQSRPCVAVAAALSAPCRDLLDG